jgi:methyl-accepting chemotaxis protein-2 (aspartate sensor receptor)
MSRLNDTSLKKGSLFVVAIFAILVTIVGAIGAFGISHSLTSLNTLNRVNIQQKTQLNIANTNLLELRIFILSGDVQNAKKKLSDVKAVFAGFLKMDIPAHHKEKVATVKQRFDDYLDNGLALQIKALEEDNQADLAALTPKVAMLGDRFYADAVKYFVTTENEGNDLYASFKSQASIIFVVIFVAVLAALAMIMVVLHSIKKAVIQPLDAAVAHCEKLAEGDLSVTTRFCGQNEIGKLFQAMEKMQKGISDTVMQVRNASSDIFNDTQMITKGNIDLATRTEEQAASLEEIASSMEELTATVTQNADNSSQASKLAHTTSGVAERGGDVVNQVVVTMSEISTSSKEVVGIIDVIDSIAFQTNILALNASVEAARAGESGRGFAVVAQEVRTLASRSAEAATKIRGLLQKSAHQVENGSELVEKAGATMSEIVESVKRVTTIMNEIASASREQSDGIGQVNQAIAQMDQVTQQNAGMVQEAANASQALQESAQTLMDSVEVFRLQA